MDQFDEDFEKHFNDTTSGEYMMVNSLTRIARDLERALIALWICGGLLGLIAFLLLFRLLIGR